MEFREPSEETGVDHLYTAILDRDEIGVLRLAAKLYMANLDNEESDEYSVCGTFANLPEGLTVLEVRTNETDHGTIKSMVRTYATAVELAVQVAVLHGTSFDSGVIASGRLARTMYQQLDQEEQVAGFRQEIPASPGGLDGS